jgi:hypothetical protein
MGHGDRQSQEIPKRIEALENSRVVKIACGGYHSIVLTSEDEIYGFGSGAYGELGQGETKDSAKPKRIDLVQHKNKELQRNLVSDDEMADEDPSRPCVKSIECGGRHTLVVTKDGQLYSWGFGQQGQLGHGNNKNMLRPSLVKGFKDKPVQLAVAGAHHSAAMTQKGDVFLCGSNTDGQLGLGDSEGRSVFTWNRSVADKNVHRIFCGGNHTWMVLDEFLPIRIKARPPSPLFEPPVKEKPIVKKFDDKENQHQKKPKGIKQKQLVNEMTDNFIKRVVETHNQSLRDSAFSYQVTFCQTKYCHRYINFVIPRSETTQF